ncbi:uncharacterized protein [Rutidosis leptorrhynchoides]|uniref:uncharacterized protein isoform X2 n=1 Tax=Rutidosis leptorrhynchoides TaxID=125765 RepID=UPI003A9971AC
MEILKEALKKYPNSKDKSCCAKKIVQIFKEHQQEKQEETPQIEVVQDELTGLRLPMNEFLDLIDQNVKKTMQSKLKAKIMDDSSAPTFDLLSEDDKDHFQKAESKDEEKHKIIEVYEFENQVSTFMHCFFDHPLKVVFRTKKGQTLNRIQVRSLLHHTRISPSVVDCGSTIMNHEERLHGSNVCSRYIFGSTIISEDMDMLNEAPYKEEFYTRFRMNLMLQATLDNIDFRFIKQIWCSFQ